MQINVKEARSRFSTILNEVEEGKEVVIMRRGKAVARLIPYTAKRRMLPSLKDFRASVRITRASLSKTVIQSRTEERA
jgi:prevent-host-death family protein